MGSGTAIPALNNVGKSIYQLCLHLIQFHLGRILHIDIKAENDNGNGQTGNQGLETPSDTPRLPC